MMEHTKPTDAAAKTNDRVAIGLKGYNGFKNDLLEVGTRYILSPKMFYIVWPP